MTIRRASRLRIILHDVTPPKPVYLSSFIVEVSELPDDFIRWLRKAAAGHLGKGKKGFPAPAIGEENSRTAEVKGQLVESRPARKKGGHRGDTKA